MFKKIAGIIERRNSTNQQPPPSELNLVSIFNENLQLFNSIKDSSDRIQLFERTISHFRETFYSIDRDQAKDPQIQTTLDKYCLLCSEFGFSLVLNLVKFEEFIDSLIFIYHTYSDLPHSDKFITFFYDLIQLIKKNPEMLDSTYSLLTLLFRSKGFFSKFLEIDGYTLVFTSFFMKFISEPIQIKFNHLLYENIPKDFTNYQPQEGLLELFVSSLGQTSKEKGSNNDSTSAEIITSASVIFICNFLTSFHRFDPGIFTRFDDMHGFLNLNNFIIANCQEIATSCYEKMLIESNGNQSVISNLFILYTREQTKPELRTSLLNILYTLSVPALSESSPIAAASNSSTASTTGQTTNAAANSGWNIGLDLFKVSTISSFITGNNSENSNENNSSFSSKKTATSPNLHKACISLDTIFRIAPIQLWILPPPQLNREGLFLIAIYLKELSRSGAFPIKSSLAPILQIIKPPIKSGNEVPVDSFLELIESAVVHHELSIQDLIEQKFIEEFILLPSDEDVAAYFEKHLIFRLIVINIYSDQSASEFRFPVIQKFIMASKYLKNMKEFIEFLSSLFSKHFSQQIIPLLLNFLSDKNMVSLFESELQKRGECYHYFLDCNGFINLEEFLKSNPDQADVVIRLLAALSYSCPRNEINEWLLNFPQNSPILTYDKQYLEKAAFAFRTDTSLLMIPAFFPFIEETKFDSSIMMNLFLAGKFGVRMYKKIYGDKFVYEKVPFINFISDRFIHPEDVGRILKSNFSSNFVHRSLPHFSVYEFIPDLFRHSYLKLGSYSFVSIFFNFPRFNPTEITIFHNKVFSIKVDADTLNVYSSKNQLICNCTIQENHWNHIIFNFRNSRRKLEIEMNGIKLCTIDTISGNNSTNNSNSINNDLFLISSSHVDGMNIIIGEEEKPIEYGFLVSKKILVSDKSFNDTKNFWSISPSHSYKGLKDARVEKIEFIFISHYQGFASFFNTMHTIEEIFLMFENEKDIEQLRILYTFLLKLQVINEITINIFWDRLFLALKRQREIIKNDLVDFAFHIPKAYYETMEMKTKYLVYLLNEVEMFFIFPTEQSINLLKFIEGEFELGIELDESTASKLVVSLSSTIRSGLEEEMILQFIPILSFAISAYPSVTKYRFFLNMAISSCDWNQAMSYSLPEFPVQVLMDIELPPTTVSNALLVSFISLACKFDTELYTYQQLLNFMLLFDDERSLYFAKLILNYSLKNPKYIKDSLIANYVFARHSDSREFWIIAFSILAGKNLNGTIFKQSITIEQKEFLPVVIEMLSGLCGKITSKVLKEPTNLIDLSYSNDDNLLEFGNSDSDNIKNESDILNYNSKDYLKVDILASCQTEIELTKEIFDTLLALNPENYSLFLQNSCQIPLYILSNLGMLPKSITQNFERVKCDFLNYVPNHLTKEEIESMISLCDHFNPFDKMIKESDFIFNSNTKNSLYAEYLTFPFDISSNDLIIKLPFVTNLLSLFSSILFSSAPNNFGNYLMDVVTGHSIMYNCFSRMFGQELIFMVIIKITISDVPLDLYHKPLFQIIAKCIKDNLFDEKIIHLLSLVFGLLKNLQAKELFKTIMKDQAVLTAYREMIIGGFVMLNGTKSLKELFTLFISCQSVVFYPPLFENREFSLIWIHVSRINQLNDENAILCIEKFMKIVSENLINEYKSDDVDIIWKSTSAKYCKQIKDEQSSMNLKDKKGKSIQNYEQNKIQVNTNNLLYMSLYRICNHYIQSNVQIFRLNIRNKQLESSQYLMMKIHRTYLLQKEYPVKSYKLSSNPLPLYNSSVVSPSPYGIRTPKFEKKFNLDLFKIETQVYPSRIEQIKQKGTMKCSPEWFYFHSHEKEFLSPFEYSAFIEQKPNQLLKVFQYAYNKFGNYISFHNVQFFYYIHSLPSVLMVTEKGIIILVLAELASIDGSYSSESEMNLIEEPQRPVAFLPLTEAVSLNEYHNSSLFCGHLVLIIDYDRFIRSHIHLYIHQKTSLRLLSLYDPTTIVVFESVLECEMCDKAIMKSFQNSKYTPFLKEIPFNNFVFSIESVQKANELWNSDKISNSDYLLLLNHFSSRSFSDLTQYPVFPWVVSPQLQPRDLSLPMGQLNKDRAAHFDTTYELSNPKYYYGFHYSIPGIVFWLLMRLPPFTFFQWDLNSGWDDQQRLFVSILDAFQSAAVCNQSDLKELIPELYSVPEAFLNISHLDFSGTEIKENVLLPDWSHQSPYRYVDVMRKKLENNEKLNEWIDLVFGYKETGEAALQAKNLFLPTCYHSATAENLNMEAPAFEAQVINFGQCPIQLFFKPHSERKLKKYQKIDFYSLISKKDSSGAESKFRCKVVVNSVPNSQLLNNQNAAKIKNDFSESSLLNIKISDDDNANDSNILIDNNSKSKVRLDELNSQNPRNTLFKNVALCDVGGYAMIAISAAIPPRFYHFVAIDTFQECLTLNSIISKKILFNYSACVFAFATNVSVSSSGMFCAVSFSSGFVNVYRIFYTEKEPTSIEIVSSFANMYDICHFSSIFSENFICVTAFGKTNDVKLTNDLIDFGENKSNSHVDDLIDLFSNDSKPANVSSTSVNNNNNSFDDLIDFAFSDNAENKSNDEAPKEAKEDEKQSNSKSKLVFWNYSTDLLQAVVYLNYNPVAITCDDVTNTVTVIGPHIVEQYTINGKKLHSCQFQEQIKNGQINELTTVSILPFNSNYDGRVVVCGDKSGSLNFFAIDEKSYELKFVQSKKIHIFSIISNFVLPNRNKIITNDVNGNKFITKLVIKELVVDSASSSQQLIPVSSFSSSSVVSDFSSSSSLFTPAEQSNQKENEADSKLIADALIDDACYCAYCDNVATVKCLNCGIPLCNNCVVEVKLNPKDNEDPGVMKLCQNCAADIQNPNGEGNEDNDNNQPAPSTQRHFSFNLL